MLFNIWTYIFSLLQGDSYGIFDCYVEIGVSPPRYLVANMNQDGHCE